MLCSTNAPPGRPRGSPAFLCRASPLARWYTGMQSRRAVRLGLTSGRQPGGSRGNRRLACRRPPWGAHVNGCPILGSHRAVDAGRLPASADASGRPPAHSEAWPGRSRRVRWGPTWTRDGCSAAGTHRAVPGGWLPRISSPVASGHPDETAKQQQPGHRALRPGPGAHRPGAQVVFLTFLAGGTSAIKLPMTSRTASIQSQLSLAMAFSPALAT